MKGLSADGAGIGLASASALRPTGQSRNAQDHHTGMCVVISQHAVSLPVELKKSPESAAMNNRGKTPMQYLCGGILKAAEEMESNICKADDTAHRTMTDIREQHLKQAAT